MKKLFIPFLLGFIGVSLIFNYALLKPTSLLGGTIMKLPVAATWGSITGTLSNQTDLQTALNAKLSSVSNSDGTVTISGGSVVSLNLGHANLWTAVQTFQAPTSGNAAIFKAAATTPGDIALFEKSDGTILGRILSAGSLVISDGSLGTARVQSNGVVAAYEFDVVNGESFFGQSVIGIASTSSLSWRNNTAFGAFDTGIKRDSAGVVKITDGGSGTGSLIANQGTFSSLAQNRGVIFSGSGGLLTQDQPGNFLYDIDGSLGSLATPTTLYIGDVYNGNSDGILALWDNTDGLWATIKADASQFIFDQGMLVQGYVQVNVQNSSFQAMVLNGANGQSADILQVNDYLFAIQSRFNKDGYFMTRKVAAPADGDVATSELALWYDNTTGNPSLKFKAKDAGGSIFNWKVPAIYADGRVTAKTGAVASVSTYNVGAADGSFLVSANVLITTSTLYSFTAIVTYTDEGNTSRTVTLNFSTVAGAITPTIANGGGAIPYEGVPLHIRCKASTSITIGTTGTFTTVVYNAEGIIQQIK